MEQIVTVRRIRFHRDEHCCSFLSRLFTICSAKKIAKVKIRRRNVSRRSWTNSTWTAIDRWRKMNSSMVACRMTFCGASWHPMLEVKKKNAKIISMWTSFRVLFVVCLIVECHLLSHNKSIHNQINRIAQNYLVGGIAVVRSISESYRKFVFKKYRWIVRTIETSLCSTSGYAGGAFMYIFLVRNSANNDLSNRVHLFHGCWFRADGAKDSVNVSHCDYKASPSLTQTAWKVAPEIFSVIELLEC